jgi:xanthine dehydrogenase YagS FAD-binding subunit
MNRFEYASPGSVKQAVAMLSTTWGDAEVLAGGTDLLGRMKDYVSTPKRVINLKNLPDVHAVAVQNGELHIGALATLDKITASPEVRKNYPALAQAVAEAASPQIRNMATIGGNLCQRPRCWYYRNGMGLLPKSAGGESLVTQGDNRYHAIFSDGPAYFVSPSTIAPILIAYDASLRITGPQGERKVPLQQFFRSPASADEREHDLKPNEIVTEVVVPRATGVRAGNYEVRQKEAFDWPLALAAVVLQMNGNTVRSTRIVLGAVAPVPWVSQEAAESITGKAIDETTATVAGMAAVAKARPLSQNAYKVKLAAVAVKRALLRAAGQSVPDVHTGKSGGAA